jgi:Cu/Ag efflux pump CusA
MNMSTWAIRNPVPPLAGFLVLCVIGMVAFFQLPVTRFPNIDVPIITVDISQAGSAPSELVCRGRRPAYDLGCLRQSFLDDRRIRSVR